MNSRTRLGFGLALLAALVWSTTGPGIRFLLVNYNAPSLAVALWRDVAIALVTVAGFGLFRPQVLQVNRSELKNYAFVGTISIGLYHALWVFSIALNGAAVAVMLIYTFPTFVTLGAWLLYGERPGRVQLGALAVSMLGCALIARAYDPAVLRLNWLGILVGLSTGITHAGYVLFSQRSVQSRSPWSSLTYTMLFGAITLFVLTVLARPGDMFALGGDPLPWLVLVALGLGPTLGGYALFTIALRYIPGSTASVITVLEAPAAALIAFLALGEQLEPPMLLGIGCILGAIIVPQLVPQRQPVLPVAAEAASL